MKALNIAQWIHLSITIIEIVRIFCSLDERDPYIMNYITKNEYHSTCKHNNVKYVIESQTTHGNAMMFYLTGISRREIRRHGLPLAFLCIAAPVFLNGLPSKDHSYLASNLWQDQANLGYQGWYITHTLYSTAKQWRQHSRCRTPGVLQLPTQISERT